jgi:hypothetical protein
MIQYRYYIGTTAGESWEHSFWKDKVFTREEVEENIETVRQLYNLDVAGKIAEGGIVETVDAYTLFDGIGFWQGVREHTIVLEILISSMNAEWFAEALSTYCKQDCVLFTSQRVDCDCR